MFIKRNLGGVTAVASPSKSSHYRRTQWKVLVAA